MNFAKRGKDDIFLLGALWQLNQKVEKIILAQIAGRVSAKFGLETILAYQVFSKRMM